MLPVEAFAIGIKIIDRQKVCLIASSSLLQLLIFYGSKVEMEPCIFDSLIFAVQRLPLSALKKGFDLLIQF